MRGRRRLSSKKLRFSWLAISYHISNILYFLFLLNCKIVTCWSFNAFSNLISSLKGDENLEPPKPGQNAWGVHRKVTILPCTGKWQVMIFLKMTLFQELCSNGDLRNHLKSFDFVKTLAQVAQLRMRKQSDNDKGLWFWWYFRGRRTKRSLTRCQSFQGWSVGVWTSSEVDCHDYINNDSPGDDGRLRSVYGCMLVYGQWTSSEMDCQHHLDNDGGAWTSFNGAKEMNQ